MESLFWGSAQFGLPLVLAGCFGIFFSSSWSMSQMTDEHLEIHGNFSNSLTAVHLNNARRLFAK